MPQSPEHQSVQQQPPEYDRPEGAPFRKAPWFFLGEENLASKGAALVLSVLWASIEDLSAPERLLTTPITNREISERSGIRGGAQAALKHLQNLERIGLIKRHGRHRNRIFEILARPEDDNWQGLNISPEILSSSLSPTQKLLLSIVEGFPRAKMGRICEKLGISRWSYYYNIKRIQPYKKSNSNPIKNLTQPYKKSNPIGIGGVEGLGIDVLPKGRTSGSASRDLSGNISPPKGNETTPPLNDNDNPLLENNMKTGQKTETTQEDINRYNRREALEQKARAIKPHNPRKKKKFSPPRNGYDRRHELDMEWIKNNCPLIHIPAAGTRSYHEDIRVVDVLERSPNAVMSPDEIRALLGGMDGKVLQGDRDPLSKEYIARWFLPAQMGQEERRRVYKDVSDSLSREYGGRGEKMRLSQALLSRRGWSRILQCWLKAPRKARDQMPEDWREYETEYYAALELVDGHPSHARVAELAHNIRATRKRWREDWRGKAPEGYDGRAYLLWGTFFKELVDYFDQQPRKIHVGWFKPDSEPMNDFLAEVGFKGFRARSRAGGYNRDEREELYV